MNYKEKTKKLTFISLFTALIITLQVIATFIHIGSFPITLTLVPIVVAGAIYGPTMAGYMGLVFGFIVNIMVVTGADSSGLLMFQTRPIITITTCLLKGFLAGYISALAYKAIKNKKTALVISAAICPIINTVTLYIALIIFFESSLALMLEYLMSVNFIIELLINVALSPALYKLVNRYTQRYK